MGLDELKEKRHLITAPSDRSGRTPESSQGSLDTLIEKLKDEDARQLAALKRARPLWWIAAGCWSVAFLMLILAGGEASLQNISTLPLRGLLALVFTGLAVALYVQMKRISAMDYSEPATLFLRKAAGRYRFMTTRVLVLSILISSVLALAASPYIIDVFERLLGIQDRFIAMISSFAFVGLVYLFGYYATRKAWKQTRGPMLEEIVKTLEDLERGSSG
jgi:hypothetical protein